MAELEIFEVLQPLDQIEPESPNLDDLSLETQLRWLEFTKSWKDIEKGRIRGRGFSNAHNLNPKRSKNVFTDAETIFKTISEAFGLNLQHEVRVKVKDGYNRFKIYKLDFFDPISRADVEINPIFHENYKLVAIRDILRKKALKRHGIRVFDVKVSYKGKKMTLDRKRARIVCQRLKEAQISPNSLEYWV